MFTCGPVPMNQAFGSDTPRGTGGAVDGAGAGTKPPGPMDSAAGAKQPGENTAAGAGTGALAGKQTGQVRASAARKPRAKKPKIDYFPRESFYPLAKAKEMLKSPGLLVGKYVALLERSDDPRIVTDENPDGVYYADYKVLPQLAQDARSRGKSIHLECLEKEPKELASGVVEMVDIKVHLRPALAYCNTYKRKAACPTPLYYGFGVYNPGQWTAKLLKAIPYYATVEDELLAKYNTQGMAE